MKDQGECCEPSGETLREAAENRLANAPPPDSSRPADELLHELQVHQIELEIQNETLRESQLALEESRDRYVDLYEFAPVGYLTLTATGQIAEINLTGAALLGVERKRLQHRRFDAYVAPKDRERWRRVFVAAMGADARQQADVGLQRGDGGVFPASVDCLRMGGDGAPAMVRVALADISQRRHAEEELRIAAIAFESQQGMVVTDPDGVIVRVNHAFSELTGYADYEVIGRPPPLLKSERQDDAFYQQLQAELKATGYWQGEIWSRRRSGTVYAAWLTITAVRGADGEVTHYVGAFSDITPHKEAEAEIHRLAFFDPLTNLPNRRLLCDRVDQTMAASSRSHQYGALLFLDLDNFKSLNDTRGHDIGDRWLIEVARRLQAGLREGDTVARLGGDEFVVVLAGLGVDAQDAALHAGLVGETLRASIIRPYELVGQEYRGALSIGIALFRNHDASVTEVLKQADLALYQAKSTGRNSVRFFEPAMQAALEERGALEAELRQALARGQLQLHYQAQVDAMGRVIGAEALLRWVHPQRGVIPFARFLHLAEEVGFIVPIGRWVLETACARLRVWQAIPALRGLPLAVNISGRQLRQPEFVAEVRAALEDAGVDPGCLKLELTETTVLDDVDDTLAKMSALRALGVHFVMDDYGTGCLSLLHLRRLPLDQLKIDDSFVGSIIDTPDSEVIVRTIIAMAGTLGLAVVAEGVESSAQLERLRACGCSAFQGFLFSRPQPPAEFEAHLAATPASL